MNKLSRTAKTLDKLIGFAYWAMIICTALMVILTVIMGFLVANDARLLTATQSGNLTLGNLQLQLAPGVLADITSDDYGSYLFWNMVFSMLSVPVYCVMLLTIRDVLKPFIQRQPFHETVARDLKKLSILVAADTVLNWIATGLMNHMDANVYDLEKLFVGDKIIGVTRSGYGISAAPLLFAAALYLLSKVFLYGEELQKLSDETL